jgi:hypothetical protein
MRRAGPHFSPPVGVRAAGELGYDERMAIKAQNRSPQFTLRSMLAGLMWFALVLAICVQYQQAAAKQRASIETLKAAGMLPATPARGVPHSLPNRSAPARSEESLAR